MRQPSVDLHVIWTDVAVRAELPGGMIETGLEPALGDLETELSPECEDQHTEAEENDEHDVHVE